MFVISLLFALQLALTAVSAVQLHPTYVMKGEDVGVEEISNSITSSKRTTATLSPSTSSTKLRTSSVFPTTVSTEKSSTTKKSTILTSIPKTTPIATPSTTTTRASTKTTTTASATPSCPTYFKLLLNPGSFQYFVEVDNVRPWGTTNSSDDATIFELQNGNRLVPASVGGGYASVPEGTGPEGNYITTSTNEDQFLVATFDYYCALHLTKKISDQVTLDTVYALDTVPQVLYIQPQSRQPPQGAQQVPLIALETNYTPGGH